MTANNQNNAHHCDALVIHCIDFRFHEAIKNFLQNELGIKSYDLLTIPGAAKHLTAAGSAARRDGLLEDIGISIKLHEPKEIILINHSDCGAYGGRAAFSDEATEEAAHRAALEEAKSVIGGKHQGVRMRSYYARLLDQTVTIS